MKLRELLKKLSGLLQEVDDRITPEGKESSQFLREIKTLSRESQQRADKEEEISRLEARARAIEVLPRVREDIRKKASTSTYRGLVTKLYCYLDRGEQYEKIGDELCSILAEEGFKASISFCPNNGWWFRIDW